MTFLVATKVFSKYYGNSHSLAVEEQLTYLKHQILCDSVACLVNVLNHHYSDYSDKQKHGVRNPELAPLCNSEQHISDKADAHWKSEERSSSSRNFTMFLFQNNFQENEIKSQPVSSL